MNVPSELMSMLDGEHGTTKQKAARLVIDLASSAGADEFVRCDNSHVSGVSVITVDMDFVVSSQIYLEMIKAKFRFLQP